MSFHSAAQNKILSAEECARQINGNRLRGKKIIFTNGCFDIVHPGHIDYLLRARDLGNFLILGLNSDDSVRRLNKAPNRPVNNEASRAAVLSALQCIDRIVIFNEDTPYKLIKKLQPDVLVKGSDYKVEDVVGYDIVKARGGEVVTIPFLEGFSTTSLIAKLNA